jgi:hypothetical protein
MDGLVQSAYQETDMESIADFLAFRTLISPSLLILFYYLGALGVPIMGWIAARWLLRRLRWMAPAYTSGRAAMNRLTRRRDRRLVGTLFALMFIFMFLAMEIGWRMMFEFMLAYFQMRDALLDLAAPM